MLAVFPRLSALADRITVEPAMLDEAGYLAEAMAPHGIAPEVHVVGVEPTEAEIGAARDPAAAADACILFLYDAHLYASNRALLDALQASGGPRPRRRADARPLRRRASSARHRQRHRLRLAPLSARRRARPPAVA